MDGGLPWASVISLGLALVALGAFGAKLTQVAEKVRGLERSRESHGKRLGALETWRALQEQRRHLTQPGGLRALPPAEPAKDERDDDDERSGEHNG